MARTGEPSIGVEPGKEVSASLEIERARLAGLILGLIAVGLAVAGVAGRLAAHRTWTFVALFPAFWSLAFFAAWRIFRGKRLGAAPLGLVTLFLLEHLSAVFLAGPTPVTLYSAALIAVVATLVLEGERRWMAYAGVAAFYALAAVRPSLGHVPLLSQQFVGIPVQSVAFILLLAFSVGLAWMFDARRRLIVRRADEATVAHQKAEWRARSEELARIEANVRANAIRQLCAGLAHDLNNVLTAANMVLPRMERDAQSEEHRRWAKAVREALESGLQLVTALRTLGSKPAGDTVVDLGGVVRQACELAAGTIGADVALDVVVPPDGTKVRGDPARLYQIAFNLVHNAVRAVGGRGQVRVTLESRGTGATGGARLRVEDSGPGVPAEVRDHIFEPYVTTQTERGGTGLGLAVVAASVAAHGGTVRFESAGDLGGACFVVDLPSQS